MKTVIIALSILFFFIFSANAQFDEFEEAEQGNKNNSPAKEKFLDNLFYGGDLGLQFGTVTLINVSPQIGYYYTKYTSVGIIASYIYYKNKMYNPIYTTSMYGGSFFTEAYPLKFIVLHAEIQALNVEYYNSSNLWERTWDIGILGGGGYRSTFGKKGAMQIMILWNFNQTDSSPFTNPIFRFSITF